MVEAAEVRVVAPASLRAALTAARISAEADWPLRPSAVMPTPMMCERVRRRIELRKERWGGQLGGEGQVLEKEMRGRRRRGGGREESGPGGMRRGVQKGGFHTPHSFWY